MTLAEAHVWIAVFASKLPRDSTIESSVAMADWAVEALRLKEPEQLKELDDALRQGPDIP